MRDKNLADFLATQKAKKDAIQAEGKRLAARLADLKKSHQDTEKESADQNAAIAAAETEIKDKEACLLYTSRCV